MAKRRSIPPYLTLPADAFQADPADGWEMLVDGQPDRVIPDKEHFPSWDSSLKFTLRRRFTYDPSVFTEHLGIPPGQASYQFVARLEVASGLMSQVAFRQIIDPEDNVVEVEIAPDSKRMSKDIAIVCSAVIASTRGDLEVLSPSRPGSRVWIQEWSAKLEGGRVRLPIEIVSFSSHLYELAIPNALIHVSVADDLGLEFEQGVCVYLNSDHPRFVADFERGERSATAMVWDAVVRQVLSAGLSATCGDDGERHVEDSLGLQLEAWMESIFPGESRGSIAAVRQESPGIFEGRIQSWVNAGAFWSEDKS